MFFRFYKLYYSVEFSFINPSRHYAKAATRHRRKEIKVNENEAKSTEGVIPIIKCKRNAYNFYKNQNYSKKNPVLLASRAWSHKGSRGDYFFIYPYDMETNDKANGQFGFDTFYDFNLESSLCSNLQNMNIINPLEVQQLGIPKILQGYNAVLAAETGCGKTLTYLLPLIHKILKWKNIQRREQNYPLGLIVTPTRELAVQIALELIKLSKNLGIRTKMITGGQTKKKILNPSVEHVDIIVASFGVISKLNTVGVYNFNFVRYVVLDEADALFHEMFEDKLKVFMKRLPIGYYQESEKYKFPNTAQLVLSSATIPTRLKQILGDIVTIDSLEYIKTEKLHKILVEQKFVRVGPSNKPTELLKYIKPKVLNNEHVIVFCNTRSTSYWLYLFLNECGIKTTNLNGNMTEYIRRGKYGEFLNGKAMVLSSTDAGSRGLDTVMVNNILNYDFPLDTATYIHRCGRTCRVGTTGNCRVTSFISTPKEVCFVQKIEYAVKRLKPLPIINYSDSYEEEKEMEEPEYEYEHEDQIVEDMNDINNIPY